MSLEGALAASLPSLPAQGFDLSSEQARLWALAEDGAELRVQGIVLIEGPLAAGRLAAALRGLVDRHEVLRTTFRSVTGMRLPYQVIGQGTAGLPRIDLRQLDPAQREAALDAIALAERTAPFDPAAGPAWRATLATLAADRHALVVTLPALVADAASLDALVAEIALASGDPAAAAESEPLQYADYCAWQSEVLTGDDEDGQAGRAHWAGLPLTPCLERTLAPERPRAESGLAATAAVSAEIDAATLARIEAVASERDATVAAFVQAGWQALLARWTGEPEVVVGALFDRRGHEALAGAIGPFGGWLPVRCDLAADPAFAAALWQVEGARRAAAEHQDHFTWPAGPGAGPAVLPFGYEPLAALPRHGAAGLAFSLRRRHAATECCEAKLVSFPTGRGLALELWYDAARLSSELAARLLHHLTRLLASAAASPATPVSALSILEPDERRELLASSCGECHDHPRTVTPFHHLIADWATRTPAAPAVACEDRFITYGELDARANQVAHRLRRFGVGPEVPVALSTERSLAMIVGLVGIAKAGGAYVPLDPSLPRERLALMLEEARPPVVVTEAALAGALPVQGTRVILLDDPGLAAESAGAPEGGAGPHHLAYVIFTSGSTGRPKGVAVAHRQLAGYVDALLERLAPPPGASFATVSTLAADLGNTAIFAALASGGCLHVLTRDQATDPARLAAHAARRPIDYLKITPQHLAALLAGAGAAVLPRRGLVLGGEACPRELVDRVRELAPGCRVFNHYGPTEATVGALAQEVDGGDGPVALGLPLAHARVYVLDRHLEPCPPGLAGEVWIGGTGVARGYLRRPGPTAAAFLPSPFGEEPGARLYRTGDLGRRRCDGAIEFLGRCDDQVKIRGFRVEPGEVEAALRSHPAVLQAVVAPRGGRLVAWVVQGPRPATPEALREALAERLPEYMLPAAIATLPALPLTANGKVDRRALPEPERAVAATGGEALAPPATATEEIVAGCWAEVLKLERVGRGESFFDLGGHSLLATRVVARVRELFGVELPVRRLFEAPTVAALAARIDEARREARGAAVSPIVPIVPIAPGAPGEPPPLSFAQQRLWFLDRLEGGGATYNVRAAARLDGRLDRAALAASLAEIVRRHEVLRTTFPAVDGVPRALVHPARPVPLPVVDLAGLPEAAREALVPALAATTAERPFDLAAGPLLRAALLRLAPASHLLLMTRHHVVSDAWSTGIFMRELATLYAAFTSGAPSPLPELAIQYGDYARWQREHLAGEVLARQVEHWRRELDGAPPLLELPTDRPRPAVQTFRGGLQRVVLDEDLADGVSAVGRRSGATLFMTLLAAFAALLARLSGQRDLVIGTPIASRTRLEVEPLIGFFVNTLALRLRLGPEETLAGLLRRARQVALDAYDHQDVPFEHLVEALQPERTLSHSPLFQVMLALQNAPIAGLELPGLAIAPLPLAHVTAKFDLTLTFEETAAGLSGLFEHRSDLFDGATVARFAACFRTLLAAAVAAPEAPLKALPLLGEAERHQVLVEWNDRAGALPDRPIPELIAEQARRAPDRVAVVDGDRQVSYGELACRAGVAARRLAARGIEAEAIVALLGDRGIDYWTAMLAVLAAGGAYLPLDPGSPPQRLAQVVAQSGAALVLATGARRALAAQALAGLPSPPPLGGIAELLAGDEGDAAGAVPAGPTLRGLAYVIFTSGSTGLPKGAMVEHRGMWNHTRAKLDDCGVTAADTVAQNGPQSFDVSVWQFVGPLTLGARVQVVGDAANRDPARLLDEVVEQGTTVLEMVPAQLAAVVDELTRRGAARPALDHLRWMVPTGEALPPRLCREWLALYPGIPMLNTYGTTECSDDVSHHPIRETPVTAAASMTIGRPIPNLRQHVLDERLEPAPIGVVGDLYTGGLGVGRGYLREPSRTARAFVPDPYGEPGARLYRTGDRARLLPDGTIEFLGRSDFQQKLNGFRIELEEIEAATARVPGVRAAAVAVREGAGGARRLVAWVVPEPGRSPSPAELYRALTERLPAHMIPTAFVPLERLPQNANGKVDRRALPAPDLAGPADIGDRPVPPRDALEMRLALLWEEVLGTPPAGVRQSFFTLGGSSLSAVRLMARIERQLGRALPLATLFQSPTIEGLAAVLRHSAPPAASPLVPLRAGDGRPPLVLVHPAGGGVLCYADLVRQLEPGLPVWGFEAPALAGGPEPPPARLVGIAARYVAALRAAQREGPYHLAGWSFGGAVAFEMARQLAAGGEEVGLLALIDSRAPDGPAGELDDRDVEAAFLRYLAGLAGRPPADITDIADEPGEPLAARVTRAGLLPPEATAEQIGLLWHVFAAHHRALAAWRPRPWPGRLTLFVAADHPAAPGRDRLLGWGGLAADGIERYAVPGDHYGVVRGPGARAIARGLEECLAAATRQEVEHAAAG